MTAVVFDGKVLAADRRIMAGNTVSGSRKKIIKWSEGWFAYAGDVAESLLYKQYLNEELENFESDSFHAIVVKNGKVYEAQPPEFILMPVFIPTGIGSGGSEAEVLCRVGYTAKEAIAAVCKWNKSCGGKIDTLEVNS